MTSFGVLAGGQHPFIWKPASKGGHVCVMGIWLEFKVKIQQRVSGEGGRRIVKNNAPTVKKIRIYLYLFLYAIGSKTVKIITLRTNKTVSR